MSKYDEMSPEEYYNLPLFDKIKDNLIPEEQQNSFEQVFGPSAEEFFNNFGDVVKPTMENVSDFVGKTLGTISGDTQLAQNAYLQHMANSFSDYSRIKSQAYNADEAKKAFDRQWFLQQEAQKFNAEQAELNHMRNLEASSTAYQRQVADMKEAGLNPYLAYSQGGAPMASSQSASVGVSASPSASVNAQHGAHANTNINALAVTSIISTIASTALGLAKMMPRTIASK